MQMFPRQAYRLNVQQGKYDTGLYILIKKRK